MFIQEFNLNNVIQSMTSMQTGNDEVFLLLVGEHTNWDADEFVHTANSKGLTFFGGIFPSVISGGNKYEKGVVIKKFAANVKPVLQTGLNFSNFDMYDLSSIKSNHTLNKRTAIIMVDGLSTQIARLLEKLYSVLGDSVNYIGGGAGSLSFVQKPSVFCNKGVFQDAAVIAFVDSDASLGVKHGWEKIDGPFVATKTDRNTIQELNWDNPFTVYKKAIFEDSGENIDHDNFFSIAKSFPFGITKEHSEYVVRDPISVNKNGELVCVGEVLDNTVLDILKGEPDTLVSAAKEAALQAVSYRSKFSSVLLFDCISRALFLESDFSRELEGVSGVLKENSCNLEIEGVLSLGEISSAGQGYLEFFNKTILISLFHE